MHSFSRLLVLAVLGVSISVHAAPVPADSGNNFEIAARGAPLAPEEHSLLLRSPNIGPTDDTPIASPVYELETDGEDSTNVDDLDSTFEVGGFVKRASRATTKPKTTKIAAAKTTKAAIATKAVTKAATTTRATTKAAAPKASTKSIVKSTSVTKAGLAKATSTVKASTGKASSTARASTAKTSSAAKASSVRPSSVKASSTKTQPTASSSPAVCSIKSKPVAPKKLTARMYEALADFFRRGDLDPEFIGWHGTNSDTAAFWTKQGQLEKPPTKGFFDFLGLRRRGPGGTSGADAELGPGVYITDDREIALAFANNNAKVNSGTTPSLCAIFAKREGNWRNVIRKAFIPERLVGDSSDATIKKQKEDARLAHVKNAVPGVSAPSVVKFSLLNRKTKTGQLVLPASITNQFTATCIVADEVTPVAGASTFPAFSYNGATLRTQWQIAAEDAGSCS